MHTIVKILKHKYSDSIDLEYQCNSESLFMYMQLLARYQWYCIKCQKPVLDKYQYAYLRLLIS